MAAQANTGAEYEGFIGNLSSRDAQFRPLNAFLSLTATTPARIHLVTFRPNAAPQAILLQEADLETQLEKGVDHELYIVEDLSPHALKTLGGHCKVDARFFLDYLDTVSRTPATTKASRETRYGTVTLPWYRLGDIENHTPPLRSVQKVSNHVHLRFIGSREYHPSSTVYPSKSSRISERLDSTPNQNNVHRIAGGHSPIETEDQTLWDVAMTRHSVGVWFDAGVNWRKAIVLLDPPFKYSQEDLERQNSKYRSFLIHSTPKANSSVKIDNRDTYTKSYLRCLQEHPDLRVQQPSPVSIIQDLYRIIASEWIAVNAYFERDLNSIEWLLEQKTPRISDMDGFLDQLFIMRRRTRKYESLVEDQIQTNLPAHWLDPNSTSSMMSAEAIHSDFEQVRDLIQRNNERIAQTVDLITSLMSVIESKMATEMNRRLTILTILATVGLPFNVYAAVFGMQTEYAPGSTKFGLFLAWAASTVVVVLVLYLGVLLWSKAGGDRRRHRGLNS